MTKCFYKDADVDVSVSVHDGQPFVHLNVNRWAPSVMKKLLFLRTRLVGEAKAAGVKALFAFNRNENAKWHKFMDTMQFKKLTEHAGRSIYFLETK